MTSQTENSIPTVSTEEAAVPVRLTVAYPERLSRLLIFVKWLFVIPLWIVAGLWGIAAFIVEVIAFFAILFVGRFPRGLFDFIVDWLRFVYRVSAYFPCLLVDKWSPEEDHPLQFEVEYPERLSRGILLLKLLSGLFGVVGSLAVMAIYIIIILAIPAWFIILFTARYPRGIYNVAVMLFQWSARVYCWQCLIRDDWSLFGTTRTVRIWVVVGVIGYVLLSILQILGNVILILTGISGIHYGLLLN